MKKLFLATMATLMLGIVVVAPKAMAASCGSASQCISGGLNAAGADTSAGSLSDVLSTVTSVLVVFATLLRRAIRQNYKLPRIQLCIQ